MIKIELFPLVGDFGEDKDIAASLREDQIKPSLDAGNKVRIDFKGVTLVTQSFVHALISDVMRVKGEEALKFLEFKNCVELVRGIISTVVQYSLDTMTDDSAIAEQAERDEQEKRQSHRFMGVARALACDESEERFDKQLEGIAKPKAPKATKEKARKKARRP